MNFFSNFTDGWKLFKDSFIFITKRPAFLFPIFFSWIIVSFVTLYLRYYWQAPANHLLGLFEILLFLILITYSICIANMVMLELLQSEQNKQFSLGKALRETIFNDAIKAIPIALIWAILWFILLILQALTSRRNSSSRAQPSLQDAAMTLGGVNSGSLSWSRLGLEMLEKVLRLISFLALPGIAWQDKRPFQALKESVDVLRSNPIQFLAAYTLTSITAGIMALPLILFLVVREHIPTPDFIWSVVLIYEGLVWSLSIYLEQMTIGLLYLKYMNGAQASAELSTPTSEILNDILNESAREISGANAAREQAANKAAPKNIVLVLKWGLIFCALLIFAMLILVKLSLG